MSWIAKRLVAATVKRSSIAASVNPSTTTASRVVISRCLTTTGQTFIKAEETEKVETDATRYYRSGDRMSRGYSWINYILGQKATHKFSDWSKLIVVDGNIGCGKSTLGRAIAEHFGMMYFPEPDVHYFDHTTGDGAELPAKFTADVSLGRFYDDPRSAEGNTFRLQLVMFASRFLDYCDGMEHLLATGQGVVLDRSVYSDWVFLEAIFRCGYIRRQCYDYYRDIEKISVPHFHHPHMFVYLDVEPEVSMARIKKRGIPTEQKIEMDYLKTLRDIYRDEFIPKMAEECEVLQYDWNEFGDVDQVIDDMEYCSFKKSKDWVHVDNRDLHQLRTFCQDRHKALGTMLVPKFLPEIVIEGNDAIDLKTEYQTKYDRKYAKGFNKHDSDDEVHWFK